MMAFVNDTMVFPMESQMFGERNIGGENEDYNPYMKTEVYTQDLIGLKTLDDERKIKMFVMEGGHL